LNRLEMKCIEVTQMEGYIVVRFQVAHTDLTIYSDGTVGVQIDDGTPFEVGKCYGLDLKPIE
jgi:hypothetical protein